MAFTDEVLGRVVEVAGKAGRIALAPWGGVDACLDAYETAIRAVVDAQLDAARAIPVEPLRSVLASTAHLTRDLGAAQLSSVRWILDG